MAPQGMKGDRESLALRVPFGKEGKSRGMPDIVANPHKGYDNHGCHITGTEPEEKVRKTREGDGQTQKEPGLSHHIHDKPARQIDEKAGELLGKDLAIQENGIIVIDVTELGYNKVLGKGRITQPLRIKSPKFSQTALTKIENAGGEAVVI